MPKVIQDLELLRKLEPYIKGETEYIMFYSHNHFRKPILPWCAHKTGSTLFETWYWSTTLKTLNTEEAFELLPHVIYSKDIGYSLRLDKRREFTYIHYYNWVLKKSYNQDVLKWDTLLQALEKMLNYLINNNLMEDENKMGNTKFEN